MKKYFGLMLALVIMVLPLTVNATSRLSIDNANCINDGDFRTCKGVLITDKAMPQATVTFTAEGGAEISSVTAGEGAILSANNGSDYTFVLNDPTATGEIDLFVVTYKKSGEANCKVNVAFNGSKITVPDTPTPDEPTDNKQTGSTLPYIALGVIALGALGAYVATRNKAKMYKI